MIIFNSVREFPCVYHSPMGTEAYFLQSLQLYIPFFTPKKEIFSNYSVHQTNINYENMEHMLTKNLKNFKEHTHC